MLSDDNESEVNIRLGKKEQINGSYFEKRKKHRHSAQTFFAIVFVFCMITTTAGATTYLNSTNNQSTIITPPESRGELAKKESTVPQAPAISSAGTTSQDLKDRGFTIVNSSPVPSPSATESPEEIAQKEAMIKQVMAGVSSSSTTTQALKVRGFTVVNSSPAPTPSITESSEEITKKESTVRQALAGSSSSGVSSQDLKYRGFTIVNSSPVPSPSATESPEEIAQKEAMIKQVMTGVSSSSTTTQALKVRGFTVVNSSPAPTPSVTESSEEIAKKESAVRQALASSSSSTISRNLKVRGFTVVNTTPPPTPSITESPAEIAKKEAAVRQALAGSSSGTISQNLKVHGFTVVTSSPTPTPIALANSTQNTIKDAGPLLSSSIASSEQIILGDGSSSSIAYDQVVNGTLEIDTDINNYTFTGSAGDRIVSRVESSMTQNYPGLSLYRTNGSYLTSNDGQYGWAEITYTLPETGTFVLTVQSRSHNGVGNYSVYLEKMNPPPAVTPIQYGAVATGTFTRPVEMRPYSFSAGAGDAIRVWMSSSCGSARLFRSNGTEVYLTDPTILTTAGTYYLVATMSPNVNPGPYSLYIESLTTPGNAVPITYDQTIASSINNTAEIDLYTFTGSAGDRIVSRVESAMTQNYPGLSLYRTNGSYLTSNDGQYGWAEITYTLPETGTFVLTVQSRSHNGVGNYSLSLTGISPQTIQLNNLYTSNISQNQWKYYYLNTQADAELLMNITPSSSSSDLEIYAGYNLLPDRTTYDYRQVEKSAFGSYDILISPTKEGKYIIGIYGKTLPALTQYTLKASIGDKYVSSNYPKTVTNSKSMNIFIYGLGFEPGMTVGLQKNGSQIASAQSVIWSASTMLVASFDLSATPIDTYDLKVLWPDGSSKVLPSSIKVNTLSEGALYENNDMRVTAGTPEYYPVEVPDCQNLFITLQKIQNPENPDITWYGTLSLEKDGMVIDSISSDKDQILQVINPKPGTYTLNVTASQQGKGILNVRTALPSLPENQWVVDTIHWRYGSVYRQIEISPGQETLTFDGEAISGLCSFTIYHGYWGSPERWVSTRGDFSVIGPTVKLAIPNPSPGFYIVEFNDPVTMMGSDQVREVMLKASTTASTDPAPVYLPAISSITPLKGGNSGTVTIFVRGYNLQSNGTVALTRSGGASILAKSLEPLGEYGVLANFDLTNQNPGQYLVVMTNPDGESATSPVSFSLEQGGKGEFWYTIEGRGDIRVGRPATYILKYGNRGTVDMPAPQIRIAANPSSPGIFYGIPIEHNMYFNYGLWLTGPVGDNIQVIVKEWRPLDTPVTILAKGPYNNEGTLPAGYSTTEHIYIRSDQSEPFSLGVFPLTGDPTFSPSVASSSLDALAITPGIPLSLSRSYPGGFSEYLGPFGYGWSHSLNMRLEKMADNKIALKNGGQDIEIFTRPPLRGLDLLMNYSSLSGDRTLIPNADGTYSLKEIGSPSLQFHSDLLLGSIVDLNGNSLTMGYNTQQQLIEVRHSSGGRITLDYNGQGRISRITEPNARTTNYGYDATGTLLTSMTAPDGSVTHYDYISQNNAYGLVTITTPEGIVQHLNYDGNGRITETYVGGGEESNRYSYDSASRTTTLTDSMGSSSVIRVNEFGKIISEQNAVGAQIQNEYNSDQNLVKTVDPMGNTYQMAYDSRDNLIKTTNPLNQQIQIRYDSRFDAISDVTDARGNTIRMAYDSHGNMQSVTHPDTSAETMVYDSVGNMVEQTTRKGDTIEYTYNSQGQVTRKDYPDGSFATFGYDAAGNMIMASDPNGTISMQYNIQNQMVRVDYPDGYWFNYTYDTAGRLVKKTESSGYSLSYDYNDLGYLIRISNENNEDVVQYSYDAAGRLSKKTRPNGASTTYQYDSTGQVIHFINYNINGSILSRFDYTYELNGNAISIDTLEGHYAYEYDAIGQLTKVIYPDGHVTQYSYDAAGNRISVLNDGAITVYDTNEMNQYTTAGSASFNYDRNGNLITKTENSTITHYEYNVENRLSHVVSPTDTWEYQYDVLGNRVGVTHNGLQTKYRIEPQGFGNVVAEYDGNGSLQKQYIHGIGLISQIDTAGNEYSYQFDPTGHVIQMTNSGGTVVNQYKYTPFGEYRQKSESVSNPFTYVGEYGVMDDGNGFHYMRMRYFSSNLGRFISEDPILVYGTNSYTYCKNSPVKKIDPIGLFEQHGSWYYFFRPNSGSDTYAEAVGKTLTGGYGAGWAVAEWGAIVSAVALLTYVGFVPSTIAVQNGWNLVEPWFLGVKNLHLGYHIAYSSQLYPSILFPGFMFPELVHLNICGIHFGTFLVLELGYLIGSMIPITPHNIVDPEDKYGPNGFDQPDTPADQRHRYLQPLDTFSYRVDFWNAENATAPVCDVEAYDQLDSNLNWSTFGFTEVGFINHTIPLEPTPYFNTYIDMRPEKDLFVQIEGKIDPGTGMVNITYHTLDPVTLQTPEDPLAGFLPPISDSGREIGWFAYEVDPKSNQPSGTVIENRAWVNFDYTSFMPAPKDAPWRNTIDAGKPSSSLTATLVNETEINAALSGSDDASGIRYYTIFASVDNGEYKPYLNQITGTSATFNGLAGHTYRLYSIATDNVGNFENSKSSPESTITIPVPLAKPEAWFTASPAKGPSPLTVNFTDQSDNNPTAWNWNFGDGSAWVNGTTETLSHTYTSVGNYTATLIVRNSAGQDQTQRTIIVTSKGLLPLPGFTNPPTDPDGDGLYEDLNGNLRKDFNDVVLMFNHMQWIAANEPSGAFDFDFNANGRIDFNDIVKLFGEI
jgi:RHS repeat-associated protein